MDISEHTYIHIFQKLQSQLIFNRIFCRDRTKKLPFLSFSFLFADDLLIVWLNGGLIIQKKVKKSTCEFNNLIILLQLAIIQSHVYILYSSTEAEIKWLEIQKHKTQHDQWWWC